MVHRISAGNLQRGLLYTLILSFGLGEVLSFPIPGKIAHFVAAEIVLLLLLLNSVAAGLISGFRVRRFLGDPSSLFLLLWLCLGFISILSNYYRGMFALESLAYWVRFCWWAMIFWIARGVLARDRGMSFLTIGKLFIIATLISLLFVGLDFLGIHFFSRPFWADFSISKHGGAFRNPTSLGAFLSIALGISLGLMHARKQSKKILLGIVSFCIVFSMLLTFSRAVFLEIFIVIGAFWLTVPWKAKTRVLLSAAVLGFITLLMVSLPQFGLQRIALATVENLRLMTVRETDIQTRIGIWDMIAKILADHPLLGIGTRNFKLFFHELRQRYLLSLDPALDSTHNFFLQVLVEQGLIGFCLYSLFLLFVFRRFFSLQRKWRLLFSFGASGEFYSLSIGLFAGLVGVLFGELFESQTVSVLVICKFLVLGLLDGFPPGVKVEERL